MVSGDKQSQLHKSGIHEKKFMSRNDWKESIAS